MRRACVRTCEEGDWNRKASAAEQPEAVRPGALLLPLPSTGRRAWRPRRGGPAAGRSRGPALPRRPPRRARGAQAASAAGQASLADREGRRLAGVLATLGRLDEACAVSQARAPAASRLPPGPPQRGRPGCPGRTCRGADSTPLLILAGSQRLVSSQPCGWRARHVFRAAAPPETAADQVPAMGGVRLLGQDAPAAKWAAGGSGCRPQ